MKNKDQSQYKEMYCSAFVSIAEIILILDRKLNIVEINHVLPGFKKEKVLGSSILGFVDKNYHNILKQTANYVFRTGKSKKFNCIVLGSKSQRLFFENHISAIKKNGKVVNIVSICIDNSEEIKMMSDLDKTNKRLVETQKQLKKNLKNIKSLDKEKDAFISISAHELKTPLTAIHGFSQLLENEDIINDKEMRNKYLGIIDKETKRLSNLVTEILDLSRIDLKSIKFTKENVNLYELVESINQEEKTKLKDKRLKLYFEMQKDLPLMYTDKEKLTQILINLIDNAIKYTPSGSVKASLRRKGSNVLFSVSDTGVGIPKKSFNKIFTRFYQVDSSYTRSVGGSGLGLSICKKFINAMGGRIWFDSKVGKGTTFYFTLPIRLKNKKGI